MLIKRARTKYSKVQKLAQILKLVWSSSDATSFVEFRNSFFVAGGGDWGVGQVKSTLTNM